MSWRVAALLAELSQRGITLRPAGAFLGVSPQSALTPELLARIRELKPEILSLLTCPAPPDPDLFSACTPAERAALLAIAVRPGLHLHQLAATTRLSEIVLDQALSALRHRREISLSAAGGYHLVVH
jgi:lambda repressor-like predicted transcriptional regulator